MSRTGLILFFSGVLIWSSCKDISTSGKPAMSGAEMVPVIYGLMMVDEFGNHLKMRDSTMVMKDFRQEKYSQVFAFNKTDYKTFTESYKYYLGRPGELKVIFDSVEAYSTRARIGVVNTESTPALKALEERKKKLKAQ
ncbi:DUF4296 domain-containing protein [Flavihumibacter stibioxidans]|nr:DUF4296 domain-containing protein [Flavihumibacter stibioxidans]